MREGCVKVLSRIRLQGVVRKRMVRNGRLEDCLCSPKPFLGELSSVGSERLPYKQRVGGSNPSAPTKPPQDKGGFFVGLAVAHIFPLSRKGEFSRELSSVGSERLPYKQRVGGSNPSAPTRLQPSRKMVFLCREHSSVGLERLLDKQEVSGSNPLVPTDEKSLSGFSGRLFCRSILIPVPL